MKGFELAAEVGLGVEEAFRQFVDSAAFQERFHALAQHSDVSVGNWDHSNSRIIEFRRPVSTNEALLPLTGGMVLQPRRSPLFLSLAVPFVFLSLSSSEKIRRSGL